MSLLGQRLFQVRDALHAGSWYPADNRVLGNLVDKNIQSMANNAERRVKCIVAPHSGIQYGGKTAGAGFRHLNLKNVSTIFILGPSHHYYLTDCALSKAQSYATPFGSIEVDQKINDNLVKENPGMFSTMSKSQDEEEHSIEMMMPFLGKMMKDVNANFKIVPMLVGCDSLKRQRQYGDILEKYFQDDRTVFVISTDFCHWGSRFRFQHYDKKEGEIFQSIEALDRRGMGEIESMNHARFTQYIAETKNTICGRNPIGVFLAVLGLAGEDKDFKFEWVHYSQSNQVRNMGDSSVSYASGICYCRV